MVVGSKMPRIRSVTSYTVPALPPNTKDFSWSRSWAQVSGWGGYCPVHSSCMKNLWKPAANAMGSSACADGEDPAMAKRERATHALGRGRLVGGMAIGVLLGATMVEGQCGGGPPARGSSSISLYR